MLMGVAPTVIFIPTQPEKSLREEPVVTDWTKLTPAGSTLRLATLLVTTETELLTTQRYCVP